MAGIAPKERERAKEARTMATTKTRRCIGSARFGIEPHEAPVKAFPKQPSQPDGLGRMCAEHWKLYVKGLAADRKAKVGTMSAKPEPPAEPKATTKRERRRTPMASKPAPKPEPPRVRKARETLAAAEKLGGRAYTEAVGSDEVQAALETVNGHGEPTREQAEAIEAIASEADPRSEDEIRAQEGDAA
jgi:hypothetical protein